MWHCECMKWGIIHLGTHRLSSLNFSVLQLSSNSYTPTAHLIARWPTHLTVLLHAVTLWTLWWPFRWHVYIVILLLHKWLRGFLADHELTSIFDHRAHPLCILLSPCNLFIIIYDIYAYKCVYVKSERKKQSTPVSMNNNYHVNVYYSML